MIKRLILVLYVMIMWPLVLIFYFPLAILFALLRATILYVITGKDQIDSMNGVIENDFIDSIMGIKK